MTVSALNVYPLKSARGISLDVMTLDERGPRWDRRWMLIDAGGRFMSQREQPRLALVTTALSDGELTVGAPGCTPLRIPQVDTDAPRLQATIWDDLVDVISVGMAADAWFSGVIEMPCRLVYFPDASIRIADRTFNPEGRPVGLADGFPLLLLSEASLADLNARVGMRGGAPLPMNRFRPNIVVAGARAFAEDSWRDIQVGGEAGVRCAIVKPCARCSITTVDQATGVRGKEPLATLATYRRSEDGSVMMGQNAIHNGPGTIRVGDEVRVLRGNH